MCKALGHQIQMYYPEYKVKIIKCISEILGSSQEKEALKLFRHFRKVGSIERQKGTTQRQCIGYEIIYH